MGEKVKKEESSLCIFKKSNTLIRAKYNASLLENKLIDISLYSLQHAKRGSNGRLSISIKASEIRDTVDGNKGSFYSQLSTAAKRLPGLTLNIENPDNEEFDIVTIFSRFHYKDGVLTIEFNTQLEEYIMDIGKRFALIPISIVKQFKNNQSIRLYELLKSKAFSYENKDIYVIRYKLADLRVDLNMVNLQSESVQAYMAQTKYPQNEKIIELALKDSIPGRGRKNNVLFKDWRDFKRHVLDIAIEEINDISDIEIAYAPIKSGLGGEVVSVEFTVRYKNESAIEDIEPDTSGDADAQYLVRAADIIRIPLPMKDIRAIVKKAGNDMDKIKKAVAVMDQYDGRIENITGFLISAIENEYTVMSQNNPFNDFEQNSYDFEQLEMELLAN